LAGIEKRGDRGVSETYMLGCAEKLRKKSVRLFGKELCFLEDCLLGREQDLDWLGFFCDVSGCFAECVDESAALFVDSDLDGTGRCAHDVE
jgi:hypothetical protein